MNQLLTVAEVAILLQMNAKTVYKYAHNGKIPCIIIDKKIRFFKKIINKYLPINLEK